jgi:ParB family chromosome partitioning protein
MNQPLIVLMKDRRREMIPIDMIKVPNHRDRDEEQFSLNVQSIESIGQVKDIRVNDKYLDSSGFYELIFGEGRLIAQQRLGQTHVRAEVVTYPRKQALLESLVENIARSRPATMEYARELRALHDEGWSYAKIANIACRSEEYIRGIIGLVENGEERLINGVESGLFPISFAILVAQTNHANIQNVLMDAFDQGIVGCQNFAKIRAIINARLNGKSRGKGSGPSAKYSLKTLTSDITATTQAKDSYVREAQGKESRLFTILDGLEQLAKDEQWRGLLEAEGLAKRPALSGNYAVGP